MFARSNNEVMTAALTRSNEKTVGAYSFESVAELLQCQWSRLQLRRQTIPARRPRHVIQFHPISVHCIVVRWVGYYRHYVRLVWGLESGWKGKIALNALHHNIIASMPGGVQHTAGGPESGPPGVSIRPAKPTRPICNMRTTSRNFVGAGDVDIIHGLL